MFTKDSRYYGIETVTVTAAGREVAAVKIRRLPATAGRAFTVRDGDQLDVMAERNYDDGAAGWHIADANTELEAAQLVRKSARIIQVPENGP